MSWCAFGDWGTSRLRLFRIEDGQVTGRTDGPGIGQLTGAPADALRAALRNLSPDAPDAIRLCGMAGARGGLAEVAYAECPADRHDWRRAAAELDFDGVPLRIGAGLTCDTDDVPDVMRGEEAQIFGVLGDAAGSRLVILPGTHSKWARVEDGRVTAFRTYMTGELFALLSGRSTLAPPDTGTAADEADGFDAGLTRALDGASLSASLFAARTMQLRRGKPGRWAAGYLSGLLIGAELADGAVAGAAVTLIGDPALNDRYRLAFARLGVTPATCDGTDCALKGLEMLDDDD